MSVNSYAHIGTHTWTRLFARIRLKQKPKRLQRNSTLTHVRLVSAVFTKTHLNPHNQ